MERISEKADVKLEDLSKSVETSQGRLRDIERRLSTLQSELARFTQTPPRLGNPEGPLAALASSLPGLAGGMPTGSMMGPPTAPFGFAAAPLLPPALGMAAMGPYAYAGGQAFAPAGPRAITLPRGEALTGRDFKRLPPVIRAPPANLTDEGSAYVLQVELPGIKKDDVEITVTEHSVTILAEGACEPGEGPVLLGECTPVEYRRTIAFPTPVVSNSGQAKAKLKDGVLTLEVPKKEPGERPHRIEVAYT